MASYDGVIALLDDAQDIVNDLEREHNEALSRIDELEKKLSEALDTINSLNDRIDELENK